MSKTSRDKCILITGGTGFLGFYILRALLREGFTNIIAIKRNSSYLNLINTLPEKIRFIDCELDDEVMLHELIGEADIVIHAAAKISFASKAQSEIYRTNIAATARLIDICLEHDIDQFLYLSSVTAFGKGTGKQSIDENTEWMEAPLHDDYSISKHFAEREVWRGDVEGLPVVIICPSFIIGAGPWSEGPLSIFKLIYNGIKYFPQGSTGIVDVRDVASIVVRCINKKIQSEKIIASGGNMSHLELMSLIAGHFGVKAPSVRLSKWLIKVGLLLEFLKSKVFAKEPIITKTSLKISLTNFEFDNIKSRDLLDFEYIPVQKTIEETCRLFLSTYPKGSHFAVFG